MYVHAHPRCSQRRPTGQKLINHEHMTLQHWRIRIVCFVHTKINSGLAWIHTPPTCKKVLHRNACMRNLKASMHACTKAGRGKWNHLLLALPPVHIIHTWWEGGQQHVLCTLALSTMHTFLLPTMPCNSQHAIQCWHCIISQLNSSKSWVIYYQGGRRWMDATHPTSH